MRMSFLGKISGYATLDALVAIIILALVAVTTMSISGTIVSARSRRFSALEELYNSSLEVQERSWGYYASSPTP